MHRVVRAHLDDFQVKHAVSDNQSKQFEAFLNYAIFRTHCAENIEPRDLVYEGDDPGIDGVMIFVDDSYVSSVEEVEEALRDRKRDADVTVVFTQAKTSESWSKGEINTFESAINDFLSEAASYPHSEFMKNAREVFNTVLTHVGKIRDGKPKAEIYFATTARAADADEILAASSAIQRSVAGTGYFSSVHVELINRDSIVELWTAAEGQVEATLKVLGMAPFPKTPGIDEGYAVTVRAKEFIDQILVDGNGRLRQRIFEENVRDFLGSAGDVNQEMAETLLDQVKQKRFGILNNGITMISPDVRVGSLEISIRDFQIVNGCQTSNVLFENRDSIGADATIMLKLIETSDAAVIDDIVRSTNRQAKVEENQFLATLDAVKALERYFEARGAEDDLRLYFERRKNQFSHRENVKAIRVFDIKEIARCVAAMFLDKPDIASRYPNRLTSEMRAQVFDPTYQEEVYHAAAYTLYRLKILMSNNRIEQRYSKLRWHMIMAIKYYICGNVMPNMSSRKIKEKCEEIEAFMGKGDDGTINAIRDLCASIVDIDDITRDKLKGSSLAQDVKAKALAFREANPPKTSKTTA
ncbi:AIPR protein [Pseudoxanthobacter soli DSM 19599]|uniref:AIPR protein n=2 Tax=Pseudoxanthobacter TaxID=433838 RepID=A0A1M7ZP31_9HYPH|nr:AIPR protein [Pseudoxanthobacter soli DSM 19599]